MPRGSGACRCFHLSHVDGDDWLAFAKHLRLVRQETSWCEYSCPHTLMHWVVASPRAGGVRAEKYDTRPWFPIGS